MAEQLQGLSDRQLGDRADELRALVQSGQQAFSEEVLEPGFALVREASRRTIGMEHYDVQLAAGIALAGGAVAEMQTGEGKTITAALPALVHAFSGKGVHVATVNPYLAGRDFELVRPVFEMLHVTVGLLKRRASPSDKRAAYACDVTYGPGYEFGFDYLRDQLALLNAPTLALGERFERTLRGQPIGKIELLQRGHAVAIIDEIDSVLIDEARTPLVLSNAPGEHDEAPDTTAYAKAHRLAGQLVADEDYVVDHPARQVQLTEKGAEKAQAAWTGDTGARLLRPWLIYVEQALRAILLLEKDVDYVVAEDAVQIVDESTGRIFSDRSWQDGLHQAVEFKEGLPVTNEKTSLGRISRQRYFRLYEMICGMSGTVTGSERELGEIYHLPVVPIPLRKACRRRTLPPRFFSNREAKWNAMADEVVRTHQTGQPVLVGARSIHNSQLLADKLASRGLAYQLLNGKQDEDEARIVARAGQPGAITIATNMAGRGTDIKLGPGVAERGGLHVMCAERHESSRIDRQLVGRAARQGDPGSCRLFVSGDDSLIRLFNPRLRRRMGRVGDPQGEVHADLSPQVDRIQRKVERETYAQRRQLLRQDHWLEDVLEKVAKDEED